MKKLLHSILFEYSGFLIAGILASLVWANLSPEGYGHFAHGPVHFLVNEVFMVFFFGIAMKEVTTAIFVPGGALQGKGTALSPIMGTLGGVIMPIIMFFGLCWTTGHMNVWRGFGVPTATDIAVAWLFAKIVFGKDGHPAVTFLLTLAILDDAIGMGIIAVFYPDPHHPVEIAWLGLTALGIAGAYLLRKRDVRNFWLYLAGPGLLAWTGLYLAHLHPALALVGIVPFMPGPQFEEGNFTDADEYLTDTLNAFEHFFKKHIEVGLFLFALVNAGVVITTNLHPVTGFVFAALLVGKPLGIAGFTILAKGFGVPYPKGMTTSDLIVVGMLGGIGLTVALFVSGVAYTDPHLQEAAKMGALASFLAFVPAMITAKLCGVGRTSVSEPQKKPTGELVTKHS